MSAELFSNNFQTTLAASVNPGDGTILVSGAAPSALQGGQFRVIIDSETMLVVGGQSGTTWNVLRGSATGESPTPTATTHSSGANVVHLITAGAAAGMASESPFLRLPKGWDAAWKAAKVAGSGQLAVIGDSISAGTNSAGADYLNSAWFTLLRNYLLNTVGLPLAGDYYPAEQYITSLYPVGASSPFSALLNAATNNTYEAGFQRIANLRGASIMPMVTFTPGYAVTGVDIVYADFQSGTWQWNVDGGANQTVTCTGPNTQAGAIIKKVNSGALASATHAINIGNTSNTNVLQLVGCTARTGNTGFFFTRHSFSSGGACDMATPSSAGVGGIASFPPDKIGCLGAQTSGINFTGVPTQPDAAIIALSVNDQGAGYDPEMFDYALRRMVLALRAGKANCSIMFIVHAYPDYLYSDNTTILGSFPARTMRYRRYKEAVRRVADTYNCAYLDIDARWGETPVGQGFMTAGNVHPTVAGHQDVYNALVGAF